jgi:VanZ family protein
MNQFLDFSGLTLYCGLIYALSAQNVAVPPMLFVSQDKIHHVLAYMLMGLLAWRWLRHRLHYWPMSLVMSWIFCSIYGGLDEWHQSFVIGRHADINDWWADNFGAFLAIGVISLYKLRKPQ